LDGFEGPLDLLLTLSRTQKVDLRQISAWRWRSSTSRLFIRRALRLELADYLVMAAWLAVSITAYCRQLHRDGPSGEVGGSSGDLAGTLDDTRSGNDFMARDQWRAISLPMVVHRGRDARGGSPLRRRLI
jgi:hypothetical protein